MAEEERPDQKQETRSTGGLLAGFAAGKPACLALAIAGVLFLGLGILLFTAAEATDVQLRMTLWLFGFLWIGTCLWMVAYGVRGLIAKR